MTKQRTSGPWMAIGPTGANMQSYSQPWGVVRHDHKTLVCGCFGDTEGGIEAAEANARLIAAAPDLLEALKMLLELVDHSNPGAFDNGVTAPNGINEGEFCAGRITADARAAIAKAERCAGGGQRVRCDGKGFDALCDRLDCQRDRKCYAATTTPDPQ